jgi:hypothetical protein
MIMNKITFMAAVIVTISGLSQAKARQIKEFPYGRLQPFTTDACTLFPDGTPEEPTKWQHCCVLHDLKYWAGGTEDQRSEADNDLYACVALTGELVTAEIMYLGVRVGGDPSLPTSWRWGYGWPEFRNYSELTEAERAEIERLTPPDPLKVPIVKMWFLDDQKMTGIARRF